MITAKGMKVKMRSIIRKFYLFGFISSIIVALGLFFQFNYFSNILSDETEILTTQSSDLAVSEINRSLVSKGQVIQDAADYISIEEGGKEETLAYLIKLLDNNSLFTSIYFGSVDNLVINSSGWVPPKDFDLRTRPWYIKAVKEKKLIFTEAFVNASKDKLIITIAKPVYNSNNQLLGVVAGDVSIKDIIATIDNRKINKKGYSFLIDGKGSILANPNYKYDLRSELKNISEVSDGVNVQMIQNKFGKTKVLMDGIEGYLAYQSIENTDWIIGSFIPLNEYIKVRIQLLRIFIITLIFSLVFFSFLLRLQKKYFLKPTSLLDEDVRKINIEEKIVYRVPLEEKDPFGMLRKSINSLLDKTQEFFIQLEEEKEKLKESLERNSAIVNAMPDLIFVINHEGYFVDFQASDESLLYVSKDEFIGKTIWHVMPKEITDIGYEKIQTAIETSILQSFEYTLEMPQGEENFELRIVKSRENEVIAISRNITERKRMEQKVLYLSYHDQLTGLYNRRFYEEELMRLDTKENLPMTIVLGDLNGLKLINDSFGHAVGDELIKKVAEVIRLGCRGHDIIARLGGDEFVIILPKTDAFETQQVLKRITDMSLNEKIGSIDISISFGYETKNNEKENIQDIFKNAEDYMYKEKLFQSPSMRGKTIKAIVNTLHEKNKREEQHSLRVSELCKSMGEALGLHKYENAELKSVGLLHDIGKIAIDENVLNKPSKLTDDEWTEIKRHPEIGYRILSTVNDMSQMAEYILYHHERWDGRGYPKGLKGEEIPLVSRIIAIVDSYDAMISERNYRSALSKKVAIAELQKNAGIQFDPELVKLFIEKVLGQISGL